MPRKAKKPSKAYLSKAFSEVYRNEPRAVIETRRKKGAAQARKQRLAIAFSKARRR